MRLKLSPIIGWALRLVIIAGVLTLTAHRPPYVTVGEPHRVEGQHPILCTHTRLTDEVEEWKIQRTLEMVREMGADTIVEFFPWAYIEPAPGQYNWAHADMVIEHAEAQGLTVIARMGLVPAWARGGADDEDTPLNYLPPKNDAEFADFVEAFTARYQGRVNHIILWNEPNLAFEWGFEPVDPQRYIDLLAEATPAARRGNPDVVILAGALAPTLEPPGSTTGLNDLIYLRELYESGFSNYYDVLAVHTYGFKFPPEDPPAPDVLNFRRAELIRDIMVAHGDSNKPVMITETGWNDHPRWTKAVRPSQRITYTLDAYQYAEESWPWVEEMCVWAFRYPAPTHSWPDYFTLVTPEFTPKPIYTAIQSWAHGIE